jgi:hypothetical protein
LLVGEQLLEGGLDLRSAGEDEVQVIQAAAGSDRSEVVGGGPSAPIARAQGRRLPG